MKSKMTENSYQKLAEYLKMMPLGFPSAPSGVEMRILRKLFSPEEARIASGMKPAYESPAQIAEKLGTREEKLNEVLERMLSKGLVDGRGPRGNREYRVVPFLSIHGDLPLLQIDREYVEFFEQYLAEIFAEELGRSGPPYIRAFPAEQSLPSDHKVLTFEQVSEIVAKATHYVISDCPCCRKMKLLGRDCGRRVYRCISVYYEDDFCAEIRIEYRDGRKATREEVLNLLRMAEEEGFIHTGSNIQDGHAHICNCCPDCCPFLRMMRQNKSPYIVAPSNYVATIEPDSCVACGVCAEERCPVNAIEPGDENYKVKPECCIGCGVCALTCPSGALSLVQKEEQQIYAPPRNSFEWLIKRASRSHLTVKESSCGDTRKHP